MIFKIQKPIASTGRLMSCLIHNEDQSIMHLLDITPELLRLFGEEHKLYIESNIENPTMNTFPPALLVGKRVEEQDW